MINRQALLTDLQALLRKLEADLLSRADSAEVPEVGEWLRTEFQKAKDAGRTAATWKEWLDDFITQVAAAWVLSCVFARFAEDNELIDPPRISGPTTDDRLQRARDEYELYFRGDHLHDTAREYLLAVFSHLASLPAGKDLFGQHNPLMALPKWLGPDAAGELLQFFQKIDSDSGQLVHDFTDPNWDTRFLGDLYQDLSAAARKKFALLQTPDFVEGFILDRTLEPALDEFGLTPVHSPDAGLQSPACFKMIDPACGSGHFLLGSFPRILNRWLKKEPGTNVRELVQRTLNSIHGVDINPFAIAIARFRLLLVALKTCGIRRLTDAPGFRINLACGDSLYHGRQRQVMLKGIETDESHYFKTEDADELKRILKEGSFHAIVANPPYIVPNDKAANIAYRNLYPSSCFDKYALTAPFMERLFALGVTVEQIGSVSAYVGQITANSFFKAEFGKNLVKTFFRKIDLTGVLDTSIVDIPGHTTPTVILFGRCRQQSAELVRVVEGIDGGKTSKDTTAAWNAIVSQYDLSESGTRFASSKDSPVQRFYKHPWSLGGSIESDIATRLNSLPIKLSKLTKVIGRTTHSGEDGFFYLTPGSGRRLGFGDLVIPVVTGEDIRDYSVEPNHISIFPYDRKTAAAIRIVPKAFSKFAFLAKVVLRNRIDWDQTPEQRGLRWFDHSMLFPKRFRHLKSIACAEITTHVHFVVNEDEWLFDRTAPVIQLPKDCEWNESQVCGLLNSSVSCFWGHHRLREKAGATDNRWEKRYVWNATNVKAFPLPDIAPKYGIDIARIAKKLASCSPSRSKLYSTKGVRGLLNELHSETAFLQSLLVWLQEELDWECYRLYGLLDENVTYETESLGIQLGERAFEIVMARKMAEGELTTTWFEQHGSTPITELPEHWPEDYKTLVNRRIEVIESNARIALIEQPEYKRRWNTEPWDSQVERALNSWLLDRLESYFDFDGRMSDESQPTAKFEIELTSIAKLADVARGDAQFMEVAEVYRNDPAFDVQRLVEKLVAAEHVPMLPVLRYKPDGLRTRAEWEKTWELQREEDRMSDQLAVLSRQAEAIKDDKARERAYVDIAKQTKERDAFAAAIPVPPKYKSGDFISTGEARYWALRGKLDVPKERWISFPHCEGSDGSLTIAWAGYNHLQLAKSISAFYMDVLERQGGNEDPRLVPLLGCLIELQPWLRQWHHDIDPEFNQRMDEVFEGFVIEQLKGLGVTEEHVKAWEAPTKVSRPRKKAKK